MRIIKKKEKTTLFEDFLCERNLSWLISLKVLTLTVYFLHQIVLSVILYKFPHHERLCASFPVLPTHHPDHCRIAESHNQLNLKRSLRSSSSTCDLTPLCQLGTGSHLKFGHHTGRCGWSTWADCRDVHHWTEMGNIRSRQGSCFLLVSE